MNRALRNSKHRQTATPANPFSAFGRYRSLTWELTQRDVLGRYRGASFGLVWSLLSPFMMLGIYTVAFGYILKSRWPGANGGTGEFALILFLGLVCHGFFAEVLTRSPNLVVANSNLVKRIIFPLDILPWTVVLSATFHTLMNLVVYAVLSFALLGRLPWTVVFLPFVLAPLAILAAGVSWLLSAAGVFLRDVGQMIGVVVTAMLFLSSAIIPVETLPTSYQKIFHLNPLTFVIDQARDVAYWGRMPDWEGVALYAALSLLVCFGGFLTFQVVRKGFADVL